MVCASGVTAPRGDETSAPGGAGGADASFPDVQIELRPRCRLSAHSARQLFIISCALTFFVAFLATWMGAWPALVFAALEMWILRLAIHAALGREHDYERVSISEQQVRISRRAGRKRAEARFLRHWSRVRLQAADSALHPARLWIECQGKRCELGAFLTENERAAAAMRLKRLIGAIGESPDLSTETAIRARPL